MSQKEKNKVKEERVERSIHTIVCYVTSRGALLFVLVLHACSAMDQTDMQSLIGFGKDFYVCVCASPLNSTISPSFILCSAKMASLALLFFRLSTAKE